MTNPDIFSGLSKGQFLSKVGPCQTFDNDADGYCRGDGVGTVILKRYEDAISDNDNILGSILATATNHSADAVSITHPHDKTQEILYKKVLDQAGVDPVDICYVEMHGTGTQAGDGTEMTSVSNVFAPTDVKRQPHQKLYLGSVKANVGHGEAASGVTALIKSLLMLRHESIPPHVGIKGEMNKSFSPDLFTERGVNIAFQQSPLPKYTDLRKIFVNNFSAAGGNTAVVLEEAPVKEVTGTDTRPSHVINVSARALSSLKGNLQNLSKYISNNRNVSLSSLSYTTTARRIQHKYRTSFVVSDVQKLQNLLDKAAATDMTPVPNIPKVAFTFTGQGSHYPSLAKDLYETSTQFRADILDFDGLAASFGFPSFLPLIDGSVQDMTELSPQQVQVGLTSIQMALVRLWKSWGIEPSVVIGHSLGEYAALNAAGVLSASDTIYLVGERARLLELKCNEGTHAMLAVKAEYTSLNEYLANGTVEVACINGPNETVLSGLVSNIDELKSTLESKGVKGTKLNVPFAFHSSQVEPILEEFKKLASFITFKHPTTPIMSPLLASAQVEGRIDANYLASHARERVHYVGALTAAKAANMLTDQTIWIEIGPQPVSSAFIKSTLGSSITTAHSLKRNEAPWQSLAAAASMLYNKGCEIEWNEYHRDFSSAHALLELPAYSFSLKNYWIQYTGNWCLTKGDAPTLALPEAVKPLSTTSVQTIVEEKYENGKGMLIAESDVARPDLFAAVSGHLVNGAALCPSSIYGDIGVTIGDHMYRKLHNLTADAPAPGLNVKKMEVPRPLIAKAGVSQILKITAKADKEHGHIKLTFSSSGKDNAYCIVEFGDNEAWLSEWSRSSYMVKSCIGLLQKQAADGESQFLLSKMAYKLFAALVQYEDSYRGMQRVVLNGKNNEATAELALQSCKEGQTFNLPPYWIDSVGHLGGFVMNANDELDSKSHVYVSHGWESMRFARPLKQGKSYRSYVRMMPLEKTTVAGDVYLFEGDEVIAVIGGLKFQCIPRKVLDTLLPPPGFVSGRAPVSVPATQPKAVAQEATPVAVEKVEKKVNGSKSLTVVSQVMAIIAEECGVDLSELADANAFSDLGVDSLMQLSISGRMRENLDLDVSSSLFSDYPTVGELKGYLAGSESGTQSPVINTPDGSSPASSSPDTSDTDHDSEESSQSSNSSPPDENDSPEYTPSKLHPVKEPAPPSVKLPERKANSVILQGSPKTATHTLFLFPDGGGSATSYVGIPNISPDVCVFGLNSPYMKTPEEYVCGVPGMAEHFITEMRRRQPKGPYMVGGWSAGGVIAFEGAAQLIRAGEEVSHLILIDSPCPLTIEALPKGLHKWFNSIGLLGDGEVDESKTPAWLLPHFQASITALSSYNARMIDPSKAPKTVAIWCEDGVCKNPTDPRPDPYPTGHALFLLDNKTDFGPCLWDAMVGKQNVVCERMGGNHFTMMRAPNVSSTHFSYVQNVSVCTSLIAHPQVQKLSALIKNGLDL